MRVQIGQQFNEKKKEKKRVKDMRVHLFALEGQLDEDLLKFFVDKIYTKLFKTVRLNLQKTRYQYF